MELNSTYGIYLSLLIVILVIVAVTGVLRTKKRMSSKEVALHLVKDFFDLLFAVASPIVITFAYLAPYTSSEVGMGILVYVSQCVIAIFVLLLATPFTIDRFLKKAKTLSNLAIRIAILVLLVIIIACFAYYQASTKKAQYDNFVQQQNAAYELKSKNELNVLNQAQVVADCQSLSSDYYWRECITKTVKTDTDFKTCKSQKMSSTYFCAAALAKKTHDISICDNQLDIKTRYMCVLHSYIWSSYESNQILECEGMRSSDQQYSQCLVSITKDPQIANQGLGFQSKVCLDFLEVKTLDANSQKVFHRYCDTFQPL